MLLLVLILVVLAFGLLVFAPQAGSVLAAWAAVALSAIAGIVLLVDWMQRRSAMRAGAASLEAAGNRPQSRDREWEHDPEPATEVLPVIPPAGPQGQFEEPTELTPHLESGGSEQGEEAVDPRFDDVDDSQQTVMMPAVQPPGSSARPSSATPGTTSSSGSSSPSVTETETEVGADAPSEEDAVAAGSTGDGEAGATVLVDTRKRPATEAPTTAVDRSTVEAAAPVAATGIDAGAEQETEVARPAADARGADQTVAAPVAEATAAQQDPRSAGRAGDSNLSGSDLFGAGEQPAQQVAAPETAAQQIPPAQAPPVQVPPAQVPAAQVPPAQVPPAQVPPAQVPQGQWGQPAAGWPPPGGPEQQAPPVEQVNGGPEDGEPGVEEGEPAAAALVATLEDEVVVIDEQPRYHVPGCDALTAHEPIPLPAREAVELGFTPCGWCRPNHTLAERHPAATR